MAEDLPSFDEMPSFDDMPNQAPGDSGAGRPLMFDDLPSFDAMPEQRPQAESELKTFGREAAHGALPAAGGLAAGAGAGALAGSFLGPVGTVGGAIIGGLAGAYATDKVQEAALGELGYDDSQQRAANAEENPKSAFAGQMAPALATMRPDRSATTLARGINAGLMGGVEAGQELYNDGEVSPGKIAASAVAGAALPTPNRVGQRILAPAERLGQRVASKVAGRPGREANPDAVPEQTEAERAEDQPITTGEVSLQQSPPTIEGDTVGNPASAPDRSERNYGKGKGPSADAPDMLTQGDFTPDVAQALQATVDPDAGALPRVAAEGTWLDEPAPSPKQQDFGYEGTKPVDTGIVEAAAQQPQPAAPVAPPAAQEAIAKSVNAGKPKLGLKPREENKAPNLITPEEVPPFDDIPESQGAATPANPIHDKIVAAREAVSHGDEITPAQASADNYAQGHPGRMFGRQVTLETPKGGVRVDKSSEPPKWRTEDHPTDYFKILGTKGADGDHLDMHYVGTGDRHFIIDQRNLDTGKFDEHKVMSYAKDAADAADHYDRSFSDGKGMDRLGSIKEVSGDDLKAWLAQPGKKRGPFDPAFKEGAGTDEASTLTAGEKPEPKIVTAAVTKMRAKGLPDEAIARFNSLPAGQKIIEASKYVNEMDKAPARPDRIRTAAPTVDGIVNDQGEPVTARTKTDAANKSRDVAKMNAAYEAVKARFPEEMPTAPEAKKELYENLQSFLNATKDVKYRPNFKHAPYLLARAAKKLTLAKNPSEKGWTEFSEVMHQLRAGNDTDVRQGQRIEADIGRSRRSGDEAIANAEAKSAGTNDVEDAMIRALDAKRGYIDVPHEEAEDFVTPKKVESRADLVEPKGTIDITKPEGQEALAKALGSGVGEPKKIDVAKAAIAKSEQAASPVRKIAVSDKAALNAKYAAMLETANKKGASHAAELDALPSDVKDLKPAAKDLFDKFMSDERGAVNVDKFMGDLLGFFKGTAARLSRGTATAQPYLSGGKTSSFAKTPKSMQHEMQHSLSNELHQIRQQDIEDKLQALKQINAMPIDKGARERIYFAREAGKINSLSPADKALYDQHLKPILDENDRLYDNIKAIDPSRVGPEVMDHISRITKGENADRNILMSKESSDPVEGINAIATAQKGPLMERRFVGLERQDGKRFVISLNDDGFQIWKDGKSQKVVDPAFKFEAGKSIKVGNNTFKMTEAMTPEIEAHAKMEGGAKAEYYHNAPLSALTTNTYLKAMARHLQYLHNLKSDPVFTKFARPPGKPAPDGYITTSLKNFDGWKMDPQLAHVFDDFAQPGFNEDGLNTLRKVSQAVTKTIFWMPTAHINNVGTHWFVERGWNWLPATGGYRSLAVNGAKAIKSVIAQDGLQSELRANGAGTIYGGILTQGFMDQLGKAAGEAIRKNPSKWDPIARVMGVGPSTLADAVYKGASKVMWAANDMLLTHAVLENMHLKGMSMPEAIQHAERHIPNYRVPPELITGGKLGRVLSQIMQEPTLTAFGRYHYGVFNSYAHMVKDLVKGDGAQRKEAIGNLFAMGLLAFAVYPALDKAWSTLTDNPDATAQRRGPTAVPHHLARAAQGKEDPMQAARSTVTTAPLLTNVWETLTNRDFRGKNIVEPGDVRQAAQGSLKAAGRVAVQEGEHAAKGLFSPLGTFSQGSAKGQSAAATVRDQALDIRNPSPQSRKYEANVPRTTTQQSRSRFKHPGGALEGAYNKLTGY